MKKKEKWEIEFNKFCAHPEYDDVITATRPEVIEFIRSAIKEAVAEEKDMWIRGLRCKVCGKKTRCDLSDACGKCLEEE